MPLLFSGCGGVEKYILPREVLADWQVEYAREYNARNMNFKLCDVNGDGMLTGEEAKKYGKITPFNYRF